MTLHRRNDPETSREAAAKILPRTNDLQFQVLDAWRTYHRRNGGQGATDGEIEALPQFKPLRPTTVRKRRLELQRMGYIRPLAKLKRAGMTVFEPLSNEQVLEELEARAGNRLF